MTTTTTIDPLATGIACSLEHEPELVFFTWKVQVQNLAASKATIVDASGLLTLVLDDGEWNIHSVNQLVDIGGAAVIAPRPACRTGARPYYRGHDERPNLGGKVYQRPPPDLA